MVKKISKTSPKVKKAEKARSSPAKVVRKGKGTSKAIVPSKAKPGTKASIQMTSLSSE
jgi:hypothetical protein